MSNLELPFDLRFIFFSSEERYLFVIFNILNMRYSCPLNVL
ncbi:MAG: hypothetical protein MJB12_10160 [Firmicutes bacterium]|nr:hypothetical protein [Bacillota bacterium]